MNKLAIVTFFCLCFACKSEAQTIEGKEEKKTYLKEGNRKYLTDVPSDLSMNVRAHNGKVKLSVHLSDTMSFSSQLNELNLLLGKAEKQFNLDSLYEIHVPFYRNCRELEISISKVPSIQQNLDSCLRNKSTFMDYDFLETEIFQASLVQKLMHKFKKYNFYSSKSFLEKCFCREGITKGERDFYMLEDDYADLRCGSVTFIKAKNK